MSWKPTISLIRQGETVSPGVANRALRELDGNTKYLYEWIQAAELGSTVYARGVTVEAGASVGMPVYYNSRNQQFERGLAQLDTDVSSGTLLTAASAQIWGVVASKATATAADLLLFGYAELDLSAAVSGSVTAGTYYLSGQTAGMLTQQRPPVSVPVLKADGSGKVYVNPKFVDFIDSHRHFRFELWPFPAGESHDPGPGGDHTITAANPALRGWLPADHAVFAGKAPAGAKFGYNLAADPQLQACWPPLPLNNAYMEWTHEASLLGGVDYVPGGWEGVPLGLDGLCYLDTFGIWWMTDNRGSAPWPFDFDTNVSESFYSEYYESIEANDLPPKRLALWFTKLNLADDAAVVTHLTSRDARIKVYCAGSETTGAVGALDLDLDLQLTLGGTTTRSPYGVKTLDADGKLQRGPIVEGVYAGTDNVIVTGDQAVLDPTSGKTMKYGAVGVSVITSPIQELPAILARLAGATEENYPCLYLGLPAEDESEFVAMFEVPTDLPDTVAWYFQYRAWLIGRTAGDLPQLTMQRMTIDRPTEAVPVIVGESWATKTFLTVDTVDTNEIKEFTSVTFGVTPGAVVYIKLKRTPGVGGDSYPADVGVVKHVGVLTYVE